MWHIQHSQRKTLFISLVMASLFGGSHLLAATSKAETTAKSSKGVVQWNEVLEQPARTIKPSQQTKPGQTSKPMTMDDVKVKPKTILDDRDSKKTRSGVKTREPVEKYLEVASPPVNISKIVDIYLENKSKSQGFLTGYTSKRADIDLILQQHQPSDIPIDSKFQIANFGHYIRIGHESTEQLIGYSTNYFGFISVYLEKDYYEPSDFWTRFKIAPSGQKDWYLIRSYNDPKKCLSIGFGQGLRLKRCNIKNDAQHWRFLREKAGAYWKPSNEMLDLDII